MRSCMEEKEAERGGVEPPTPLRGHNVFKTRWRANAHRSVTEQ